MSSAVWLLRRSADLPSVGRTGKSRAARTPRPPIEVAIVCRAELLLLGLERLLVQAPDLRVFTYAALPESALGLEPAFGAEAAREERLRPAPRRGPVRVALLSDRNAPDLGGAG